jgi:hypothetical protein
VPAPHVARLGVCHSESEADGGATHECCTMDVTSPVEAEAPSFATEGFAEVQPYYGPLDELEVGSMWRLEKLKDFEWKVRRRAPLT